MAALNERERHTERDQRGGDSSVRGEESDSPGSGCASLRGGDPGPNWTAPWFSSGVKRGKKRGEGGLGGKQLDFLFVGLWRRSGVILRESEEAFRIVHSAPREWTEEGWMPADLRVLKTQVNAAVFI